MYQTSFADVTHWVFDLDNTLYHPSARLFEQINMLMTVYITRTLRVRPAAARALRDRYWADHGATLTGLMQHHDIDPDPFLREVHEIDLSGLTPDIGLRAAISTLPGRKIVYTNGSRNHAERVTEARGLSGLFDALYGMEDAGYRAKPERAAFEAVFTRDALPSARAAMFEDDVRNLAHPHAMGMRTVLVGPHDAQPHVQFQTDDLTGFLSQIV